MSIIFSSDGAAFPYSRPRVRDCFRLSGNDALRVNESAARTAEQFFHDKIPLTRNMGLRVIAAAAESFAVEAPVALNRNHLQTAFGGSINAVATLAGYGFLWLELRDTDAEIVIAESAIRFRRPAQQMISARCEKPDAETLGAFRRALASNRSARITLLVAVEENGALAAEFTGVFVARRALGSA